MVKTLTCRPGVAGSVPARSRDGWAAPWLPEPLSSQQWMGSGCESGMVSCFPERKLWCPGVSQWPCVLGLVILVPLQTQGPLRRGWAPAAAPNIACTPHIAWGIFYNIMVHNSFLLVQKGGFWVLFNAFTFMHTIAPVQCFILILGVIVSNSLFHQYGGIRSLDIYGSLLVW